MARSRLDGRVVAVTGAARGIGLATARSLLERGARVAIGDIDRTALDEALVSLRAHGTRVHGGLLDVTDRASFDAWLDGATGALGELDVLVNNAGIMPIGAFLDEPDEVARRQVDINVHGVITGMKLALERMLVRGEGHVVNVASMAGIVPGAGIVTYAGTKHAVVGMTEAAHYEYAERGIRFSVVLPAFVNTELTSGTDPGFGVPFIEPEDVAAGIVEAVAEPRMFVYAPPTLGFTPLLRSVMPIGVRTRLNKVLKLDRMFLDIDKDARRAYDERTTR